MLTKLRARKRKGLSVGDCTFGFSLRIFLGDSDHQILPRPQFLHVLAVLEEIPPLTQNFLYRKRIRVLSLFDGISTGLVALKSLGLDVATYYSSEVDEDAMKCSKRNHPEIVKVGDVRNITEAVRSRTSS